jgi:hypothetical protein
MYLDDIIDHVKAYFAGNDSTVATLKVKSINPVAIRLDHAMNGFSGYAVTAVAITATCKAFNRAYIVLEYPNGEIETFEIGCLMSKQAIRKSVDTICERFLTAA